MRKLVVSQAFFTADTEEFLDSYELADIESDFGDSQAVLDELLNLEELRELELKTETLDKFWQDCRNKPTEIHSLNLLESDYETSDQYETYTGVVVFCLNYFYQPEKPTPPPEVFAEQLEIQL